MFGRTIASLLALLLVVSLCGRVGATTTGTGDGTYDFGSLGAADSGGSGFATQGDKFKVSNAFAQGDGTTYGAANSLYAGDANGLTLGATSSVVIKAEGGSTCKQFTFKDMGFDTSWVGPSRTYDVFTVTLKDSAGTTIATHTLGSNATVTPGSSSTYPTTQLSSFPFSVPFPAAGYNGVAEIDITFHAADGSAPGELNFDTITVANVSAQTLPTVSSVSPSSGVAGGGTSVTISGNNFSGTTAVKFGSTNAASYTVNSSLSITATSPAGSGTVDVTVTTASGTSATGAGDQFTYVAAPTVTSISPTSGPAAGGTSVTITGSNLTGATAVKFGSTNATSYSVNSATQITATSPAGSGTVDVTVTTSGGTSATGAGDQFTYVAAPTVTSISPTSGPAAGGTSVTITGSNLTGATVVKFGSTNATSYSVNSATQITATSPAGSGTVDVTVTTSGGTSATGAGDQFTYVAPPTVTDAHIGISGALGTGGAYRIGDTVTATWNNTASGDNNTGVTAVTVDFSQFGGGSAVTATNSSGTWTATYTILAGAIDATNRNVSVTATNGVGSTTTADSTNATVDNVAPTVTDAHIGISGGTGTGGAFKIGDTVTATWNDTASGDNNSDTIASVTVDFSQFGGSSVTATNSGGTWTATYAVTAGAIDATNRNVSVTVTDNAGNSTTTADSTNATVDNVAPTVTDAHISISGGTGTGGAFKIGDTVTATWNDTASGDNNSDTIASVTVDFSQFGGSSVTATNSGGTWTATYAVTAGAIDATNRNVSVTVTDNAGNSTTTADSTNATVDNVAPTVTDAHISISGASGTGGAYRIGDTVTATWNDTASGDNNSDTIASVTVDFSQFGGSSVTATNSSGTWTATYTVTAGAIDATNRNVSVTVTDNAGNNTTTADSTNATVDNVIPTVVSVGVPGNATYTAGQNLDFTVNFSTAVTVNTAGGTPYVPVTLNTGGTVQAAYLSGSGTGALVFRYTVVSGTADPDGITVGAAITAGGGTIRDAVGNDANLTLNSVGSTSSILVSALPPSVATGAASNVTTTGATLNGTVNANSDSSTVTFEYGPTSSYGSSITATPSPVTGTIDTAVSAAISGLTCNTSYHFRVKGVNGSGTTTGLDATLTTSACTSQTIGAISVAPDAVIVSGTTTASAMASSGLAVSFSSLTPSVCTVSGTTITGVAAGVCTIAADQAGNATYSAAPQVTRNITVANAANKVHLTHSGVTTDYTTIQGAADAAVDGDTISVDAGTFVEQVTITKAVTLQGAGSANTIIQAPDNASLIAAGPTTINGKKRMAIINLQTAAPGTVTVRNLGIDGRYQGETQAQFLAETPQNTSYSNWLIGIATSDTNAVIDTVDIQHIAAPLDGSGNYEGLGTGFGIVAEGTSALSSPVTVTVQNSTIGTFQKAGIVAWGPKINAVITNNQISGVGILGRSGQNGMQIGSAGARAGTTATISGNTFDHLGAPADLVATGNGATGILPVTAGPITAYNNTITLDPGASANSLIGIDVGYSSDVATLHDNTLNDMSVAIQVDTPLVAAIHQINANTFFSVSDPVVFYYDPLNNGDTGGETIANFGVGYAIRVVGENFSSGALAEGDGTSVAANSVQVSVSGGTTTLYIDTTVANGSATPPLTVILNGTYVLGNFALNGEYLSFTKAPQTISFTTSAPSSAVVGGSGYTPAATGGGSGNPVVFTIDSASTGVCAISGGTVTFQGAGTCTVDANQAGNVNYNPASQASQSFAVGKGSQTITFTSVAPSSAVVGGPGYTPVATGGGSGNPVVFTIDSASTGVCAISGGVVTSQGVGTCIVDANQAGNATYAAASQASQSFAVAKGSQTITLGPAPSVVVGSTGTLSATATSGGPVTLSSTTPGVCSVSGTIVTGLAAGTCTIAADQAGNANYAAAPQVTQDIGITAPLALTVSALSDGAVTTESTQNVSGVVTNPAYLRSLTINGIGVQVNSDGSFSYPVQLVAGANTVTVIATGTTGETIVDSRTITLDSTAPHLSVTYPPDNKVVIQNYVIVTGTITSLFDAGASTTGAAKTAALAAAGTTVIYSVNGSAPQIASLTDTTYTFTANLDQGMNTILITAEDSAGKTVQAKRTTSYMPAFSLAVTDPASDIRTVQGSYLLTGSVTDNTTPVAVTVTMAGKSYTPTVTNGTFRQMLAFTDAQVYQVAVTGTDQNGNSLTVQRNIVHDVLAATAGTAFTIVDALQALRMSVGLLTPDTSQVTRLDVAPMVNGVSVGDGKIDIEDVVVILRKAVGLIP